MNFRQLMQRLSPTWLSGYWGERLMGMLGLYGDLTAEGLDQASRVSLLTSVRTPMDPLSLIGSERNMERYPSETDLGYRARLHDAWEAWGQGGSDESIEGQLAAYGVTATCINNFSWTFETPKDWANWSRFVVFIGLPHPWVGVHTYGSGGVFGGGWTYGSLLTTDELAALGAIIDKWKSAHEICPFIVLHMSGHVYGEPGFTFGTPGLVYGPGSAILIPHP